MNPERKRMLARIAYLYYIENKNQSEIAKEMSIYRTSVSRILKQAREEGLVQININYTEPQLFSLEQYVKEKYQLRDVLIVPNDEEGFYREAAYYLNRTISNDMTVGVSWGATLGETITQMEYQKQTNATFVPLAGGPSHINSQYHVNTLVYELSQRFNGRSIFVNASVIQEDKNITAGILNSQYFNEILTSWESLDVAIVGIGGSLNEKESRWRDLLRSTDVEELQLREAIGEICCRFFDSSGKILRGDLYDRTISLDLEKLRQVPVSIGIARSVEKARSILPAIKNKFINTLITDKDTMLHLLRLDKDSKYKEFE